jgi:hypothetical protein
MGGSLAYHSTTFCPFHGLDYYNFASIQNEFRILNLMDTWRDYCKLILGTTLRKHGYVVEKV